MARESRDPARKALEALLSGSDAKALQAAAKRSRSTAESPEKPKSPAVRKATAKKRTPVKSAAPRTPRKVVATPTSN